MQDVFLDTADVEEDSFPGEDLDGGLSKSFCPFSVTTPRRTLYDRHNQVVPSAIHADFAREYLEDRVNSPPHHIIYRRNYFTVTINYTLAPPTEPAKGNLFVHDEKARHRVRSLGVRVRAAKNHEYGEDVPISVFTAKRGPPINPPPPLEQRMQPNMPNVSSVYVESTGHGSNVLHRPIYHTFPRLQFRKATDNNGMRRRGQSFFRLVVELRALIMAESGSEEWIQIASTVSGPLLVRGRCPNSFEPYDPRNRKRKPPKDQTEHHAYKGARPKGITKSKGSSTTRRNYCVAAKTAASQRKRRISSSTISGTMRDSNSGYATPMTTDSTAPSVPESPVMVPRQEIPLSLRLPIPNGKREASPIPKIEEQSTEDDVLNVLNGEFGHPSLCKELTYWVEDLQRHRVATQLESHGCELNLSSYTILAPSSTSTMREIDDSTIPWELASHSL